MAVELVSPTGITVKLDELLFYSPETGEFAWKERPRELFVTDGECHRWNRRYAGQPTFQTKSHGYRHGTIFYRTESAHRVAWALVHGEWPADQIDHIDGDRANNRIGNLRCVSVLENGRNARRSIKNRSGHTGIYPHGHGKWRARISVHRKCLSLGVFNTLEEAITARKRADKHYGFHPNHGS